MITPQQRLKAYEYALSLTDKRLTFGICDALNDKLENYDEELWLKTKMDYMGDVFTEFGLFKPSPCPICQEWFNNDERRIVLEFCILMVKDNIKS